MPIHLTCSCGAALQVREENATKRVACPLCGAVLPPPAEGIQASPSRPSTSLSELMLSEPIAEVLTEPDEGKRERRRKAKARRRRLGRVNLGLAFHYVIPFAFLVGTGSGVLALVLTLAARVFLFENAGEAADFFFLLSGLFLLLTAALGIPPAALGLIRGPDATGQGFLVGCLTVIGAGCLPAALLLLFTNYEGLFFLLALGSLVTAWGLWMGFLQKLGHELHRPEVAEGAVRVLGAGIRTLLLSLPVLFAGGFLVAAMMRYPILILGVPATFMGAVATLTYHLGGFDSLGGMFIAPTGIPFLIDYLNFIGGVRMLILRRS